MKFPHATRQVRRLQRALKREKNPKIRQRIQMVLLRETGMTQAEIANASGSAKIAKSSRSSSRSPTTPAKSLGAAPTSR